jgi:hypothetical protein
MTTTVTIALHTQFIHLEEEAHISMMTSAFVLALMLSTRPVLEISLKSSSSTTH